MMMKMLCRGCSRSHGKEALSNDSVAHCVRYSSLSSSLTVVLGEVSFIGTSFPLASMLATVFI